MRKPGYFIGKSFGNIVVMEKCQPPEWASPSFQRVTWYKCKCVCGNYTLRSFNKLVEYEKDITQRFTEKKLKQVSCGCLLRTSHMKEQLMRK